MFKIYSDAEPKLNEESVSCDWFSEEELKTQLKENPKKFGDAFIFVVEKFFPHLL